MALAVTEVDDIGRFAFWPADFDDGSDPLRLSECPAVNSNVVAYGGMHRDHLFRRWCVVVSMDREI